MRAYILYFNYTWRTDAIFEANHVNENKFFRFARKWDESFTIGIWAVFIVITLILTAIGIVPATKAGNITPGTFYVNEVDCVPQFHKILMAIQGVLFLVCLGIASWKLWRVQDAFAFKWELLATVLLSFPLLIVWLIARFAINFDNAVPHEIWPLVIYLVCLVVGIASPSILVWKARQYRLKHGDSASFVSLEASPSVSSNADFFLLVLETPILVESLKRFMVTNWSVENLLFLQEIKEFQGFRGGPEERKESAKRIYEIFLEPGCMFEVNLDSQDREGIMEAIAEGRISPDLFEAAWVKVFNIVKHDSIPKWRQSPEFQEAWNDRRKSSSQITTSASANM